MKIFASACLFLLFLCSVAAQKKDYDVPGPIELHIYLTAKPGQEKEVERLYREEFYPAVSRQPGFVSSELMRRPNSSDYVLRHTFQSEELRLKWVATAEHQKAWPRLTALCSKAAWQGFAVIHPLR
jgi:heme-degrading monooxygenase HmoA